VKVESKQVLRDREVSCEEWSEEDGKEGEEDCEDDSSDTKIWQNGCKDKASDKSQRSEIGVSPDLSFSDSGDNREKIACTIYSFINKKLYMAEIYNNRG
jgi:hypothetical protein